MALSDVWARTLVYFGIAEEEDWDEEGYLTEEELAEGHEQQNVRRLPARRSRHDYDDDWTDPEPEGQRTSILRPRNEPRRVRNLQPVQGPGASRVHLILPRSFNDAQQVADRFKNGVPVILNLQSADAELSKRLIDFASGLTYALDGGMQRIADKVFLLTPSDVELSAEDRARMLERGFFNQASEKRPEARTSPGWAGQPRSCCSATRFRASRRSSTSSSACRGSCSSFTSSRAGCGCPTRPGSTGSSGSCTTSASRTYVSSVACFRRRGRSTSRRCWP
jgi:cell division inhibitor SepF